VDIPLCHVLALTTIWRTLMWIFSLATSLP
jgi:hypothetical protein